MDTVVNATGIPPVLAVVSLVGALVSLAAAGLAGWLARRAWPNALRAELDSLQGRVLTAEANAEALAGKWQRKTVELEALSVELEQLLESVERRRRRTAATESKAQQREQREQQQSELDPHAARMEIMKKARAMGIRV